MKIRNGFVSNSSSSSFIVAVPDNLSEYENNYLELFRHIFNTLKDNEHYDMRILEYKYVVEDIEDEIKNLEEQIQIYTKAYNQFTNFIANKKNEVIIEEFLKVLNNFKEASNSEKIKFHYYFDSCDKMKKSHLSACLNAIQEQINDRREKIEALKVKLATVKEHAKDCKSIATFTLSCNGETQLGRALEYLIEHKILKVISKVTS
jgi:DNA repair exonuclease SbcCD ATPase subunit